MKLTRWLCFDGRQARERRAASRPPRRAGTSRRARGRPRPCSRGRRGRSTPCRESAASWSLPVPAAAHEEVDAGRDARREVRRARLPHHAREERLPVEEERVRRRRRRRPGGDRPGRERPARLRARGAGARDQAEAVGRVRLEPSEQRLAGRAELRLRPDAEVVRRARRRRPPSPSALACQLIAADEERAWTEVAATVSEVLRPPDAAGEATRTTVAAAAARTRIIVPRYTCQPGRRSTFFPGVPPPSPVGSRGVRRGAIVELVLLQPRRGRASRRLLRWASTGCRSRPRARRAAIFDLYWLATGISILVFSVVTAVLVYSIIHFRAAPDDHSDGPPIHGNTRLEIAWTLIPTVLVIVIGIASAIVLSQNSDAGTNPLDRQGDRRAVRVAVRLPAQRQRDRGRAAAAAQPHREARDAVQGRDPLLLGAGVRAEAGRRARGSRRRS